MERLTVDLEAEELAALDDVAAGRAADMAALRAAAGKVSAAGRGDAAGKVGAVGISGAELLDAFARFREATGGVELDPSAIRRKLDEDDRPFPTFDD